MAGVKFSDGAIICGTVVLMGAPAVLGDHISHALGVGLFWGGLIGLLLFALWKARIAWPWLLSRVFGRVPIQDAAQELYEAAERAGTLDLFAGSGPAPYKLEHFKYVMMVDDETVLWGKEPPSRQPLPIPRDALSTLHPQEGTSQLNYLSPREVAYTDVTVSRKDLRRIRREWPIEAQKFPLSRSR